MRPAVVDEAVATGVGHAGAQTVIAVKQVPVVALLTGIKVAVAAQGEGVTTPAATAGTERKHSQDRGEQEK